MRLVALRSRRSRRVRGRSLALEAGGAHRETHLDIDRLPVFSELRKRSQLLSEMSVTVASEMSVTVAVTVVARRRPSPDSLGAPKARAIAIENVRHRHSVTVIPSFRQ